MADYQYAIGADSEVLSNIEDLIGTPPTSSFVPFSVRTDALSGLTYGNGFPMARWLFDYLTRANLIALLEAAAGGDLEWELFSSVRTYIKTRVTDGSYKTFYVVCILPEELGLEFRGYRNVELVFRVIEEVEEEGP